MRKVKLTIPSIIQQMLDDELITPCGLYCGLCAERCLLPGRAQELLRLVREEGYDQFYGSIGAIKDHYPSFIRVLEELSDMDCRCRNRAGGDPGCPIRICAEGRGAFVCMDCEDFPCDKWIALTKVHPLMMADAELYRKVGKERWLELQKERLEKGFHYGMVKTHKVHDDLLED